MPQILTQAKRSEWIRTKPHELAHVGMFHGGWTTVSEHALRSIVDVFKAEQSGEADRPPLVLGHPSFDEEETARIGEYMDLWTEGDGDDLKLMGAADVIPEMAGIFESGQFPAHSIGFYEDGEDTGIIKLDHNAILGRNRGEIGGMGLIAFKPKTGRRIFYLTTGETLDMSPSVSNGAPEDPPTNQEGKAKAMKPKSLFGRFVAFFAAKEGITPEEATKQLQNNDADPAQASRMLLAADESAPADPPAAGDADGDDEEKGALLAKIEKVEKENGELRDRLDALEKTGTDDLSARIADCIKFKVITKDQAAKLSAMDPAAARIALETIEEVSPRHQRMAQPVAGAAGGDTNANLSADEKDAKVFELMGGRAPKEGDAGKKEVANFKAAVPSAIWAAKAATVGDIQGHA